MSPAPKLPDQRKGSDFQTRGREVTPGTGRPLISPPWEMPMGLSVNRCIFIYFCYSAVARHEHTHNKKQEHIHGRQCTEAARASESSFLFNSVFLCLVTFLTFYESQDVILNLYLKQKQTTTKIVPASLLEFPLFLALPSIFSFNPQLYPADVLKTCPTLGMQAIRI